MQDDFTGLPEDALHAQCPHSIDDVVCQTEGDLLWDLEGQAFVEETVEVHVHCLSCAGVEKNVLTMSIAETHDVTDHRHHCCRAHEVHSTDVPTIGIGIGSEEVLMEHRGLMESDQFDKVLDE